MNSEKDFKKQDILSIINKLEKIGSFKVIDLKHSCGYFIFEFGKNTVNQFKIKGLKDWLFGIWLKRIDDSNVSIDFFFENEWFIDKFKPGAVVYSESINININILEGILHSPKYCEFINKICNDINKLKRNEIKMFHELYCHENTNKYLEYFKYFRDNKIIKKYEKFVENRIIPIKLKLFKLKTLFTFFKYRNNLTIRIFDENEEDSSFKTYPRFNVNIVIDKKQSNNDELCKDLYEYKILHKFKNTRINTSCWFEDSKKYEWYGYD